MFERKTDMKKKPKNRNRDRGPKYIRQLHEDLEAIRQDISLLRNQVLNEKTREGMPSLYGAIWDDKKRAYVFSKKDG